MLSLRHRSSKPLARGTRLYLEYLEDRITPNTAWGLNGPPLTVNTGSVSATAVTLLSGDAGGSASITKNEVDYFRFTTSAAGFYTLRATAGFDVMVGVYESGSSGKLLGYADRFGANATEALSVYLDGNKTYFLAVSNYRTTPGGSYTWAIDDVDPAPGNPTIPQAKRYLYVQFDGALLSGSDLRTWDDDWQYGSAADFDVNGDGITIQPFLSSNSLNASRESIIAGVMSNLQTDLAPFGVRVVRLAAGASAVTGVGATTLFFGVSNLDNGYAHVACDIDIGNNNGTDIAFVYDENWGNVAKEVLAMSDVALHEAGHTFGLFHVNSGSNLETMGLRYSVANQNYWANNTSYMNQSFGYREYYGSQDSYQEVARAFGIGNPLPPAPPANPSLSSYLAEELEHFHAHDEDEHFQFAFKDGNEEDATEDAANAITTPAAGETALLQQNTNDINSFTLQTPVFRAPDQPGTPPQGTPGFSAFGLLTLPGQSGTNAVRARVRALQEANGNGVASLSYVVLAEPAGDTKQVERAAELPPGLSGTAQETIQQASDVVFREEAVEELLTADTTDSAASLGMLAALALVASSNCHLGTSTENERHRQQRPVKPG